MQSIVVPPLPTLRQPAPVLVAVELESSAPLQLHGSLQDRDGVQIPWQLDPILNRALFVGERRPHEASTYSIAPGRREALGDGVHLRVGLDRVDMRIDGAPFCRYTFQGGRRPYFWPVYGPSGYSLVRGQGTGEHPHHTGLAIAYGGHGEGGSANIWSDWDEKPYGPGGRMVHRGFRLIDDGPVFGLIEEALTYVDVAGRPIAEEIRRLRIWQAGQGRRFIDWHLQITHMTDVGPRPWMLAGRLDPVLAIGKEGRITNSAGFLDTGKERPYQATWVDASGPVDGPDGWQGIAFLDHPGNRGYPGDVGKVAVLPQLTFTHYPSKEMVAGPFNLMYRTYVHAGDAEAADVASAQAAWAAATEGVILAE